MRLKQILLLLTGSLLFLAACKKVEDLPYYDNGKAVTLTASQTTIAPTAADSLNNVVTFSWTNPEYATDSSNQKFVLEIDSSGRNFSNRVTKTVNGTLNASFTGKELNNILAGFGFAAGQTFSFDVRVISSYANNNEQLNSNIIKVSISSYKVPVTLTPSSTSALVLQVSNATNTAISFNWNASPYGANTINYALQLDTAGGNFANPQVKQLGTSLNSSFTVNELNTAAIAAGVIGGSTKNVEFRIVSYLGGGYSNVLGFSNTVTVSVTTFTPIPSNFYIVGDATPLGWNNNANLSPSQEFTRISDVSYGIVINLTAGGSYLFLPVAGDWSHKFGGTSATGGTLLADGAVPGSNTPAPATSGTYQIIVNFQTGTYTVTPYTSTIPSNLYIVGDATAGGWNNPVPTPAQQFTKIDAGSYGIITNLEAGKSYLFLPLNGNWDHKYGGASASGGALLADGAVPGSNTPAPAATGTYKIVVNFINNTYTVTPYTGVEVPANLYIVGDATPGGWGNPVPVPSQQFTKLSNGEFKLTVPLAATGSYLFLPVNGSWDHKFGGTSPSAGTLLVDGAVPGSNTPGPGDAGNYNITVNFLTMRYSVIKQ
jgi:starch-binding outer membrane protein SusE/F